MADAGRLGALRLQQLVHKLGRHWAAKKDKELKHR